MNTTRPPAARRVLVIDDQPEVRELLGELLGRRGLEVTALADGDQALAALAREADDPPELVVLDLDLGPGRRGGLAILADLKAGFPELPVVILTGKGTVEDAVAAMRLGATDFVEKDPKLGPRLDLQMAKLARLFRVHEDNRRLRQQNRLLRERVPAGERVVGEQGGLRAVMRQVRRLADIPRPVLILGERGTGKELVAAALHRLGARRDGPFVTLNCAALAEGLAESELFGHERGAFTDAREARPGRLELADSGSLFLDEVGLMPLGLQQKLLRALEYQTFERVGGGAPRRVDVRFTAATNADLEVEMEAGRFRRDLYDRLAFELVRVPPLRERREDIPELARHFLERFRAEVAGLRPVGLSPAALDQLQARLFPGNVRELKNLVERAAYRAGGELIQPADLGLEPGPGPGGGEAGALRERVEAFERRLLEDALADGQSLVEAARALGLSYDQLRRLVKKHGLRPTAPRPDRHV
jgi:DNA-binding NtrC family response regulator